MTFIPEWERRLLDLPVRSHPLAPVEHAALRASLRVEAILRRLVGRRVGLTFADPRQTPRSEAAWSVTIDAAGGPWTLWIDQHTARILADAIETMFIQKRSHGQIGDVERGILDYLALAVVDGLAEDEGIGQIAVDDFGRVVDREAHLAIGLEIGGRTGRLLVHGASLEGVLRPHVPTRTGGDPRIAVRLPPRMAEGPEPEPGDVLLSGLTDLVHAGAATTIVTTTGWRLSAARIVHANPTRLTATWDAWAPGVEAQASGAGRRFDLELGAVRRTWDAISEFEPGTPIDFDLRDAVFLYASDVCWRCELVQLEGELGFRVLELLS